MRPDDAPRLRWLTGSLDLPADGFEVGTTFWAAVTGTQPSPVRGGSGQLATLLPPDGEACWRVQRLDSGAPAMHLELHTADRAGLVAEVSGRGATVVEEQDDLTVLRSPAGLRFCVVDDVEPGPPRRPGPVDWGGHTSMLDQVCLDVPAPALAAEVAFWSELLGAEASASTRRPEFTNLPRPPHLPLRLLFQVVGGDPGAHPDLASTDRDAEVARLVALGAEVVRVEEFWTVLRAPDGRLFCVTERDPATGQLN